MAVIYNYDFMDGLCDYVTVTRQLKTLKQEVVCALSTVVALMCDGMNAS